MGSEKSQNPVWNTAGAGVPAPQGAVVAVILLLVIYGAAVLNQFVITYLHVVGGLLFLSIALFRLEWTFLAVPLALSNPYQLAETGTNVTFSEFILILVFLAWVLRLLGREGPLFLPIPLAAAMGLLTVISVLSLGAAVHLEPGIKQVIRFVEIFLLFFPLSLNLMTTERDIVRCTGFLLLGGASAALVGMYRFQMVLEDTGVAHRVYGLHGGGFGALMASTAILAVGFLATPGIWRRLYGAVTFLLALTGLVLSQTRAWIGAFVLSAVVLFVHQQRTWKRRVVSAAVMLVIVVVTVQTVDFLSYFRAGALERGLEEVLGVSSDPRAKVVGDLSLLMRFAVWSHTLDLIAANPVLGIGVANLRFSDYFSGRLAAPGPGVGYVDNQYLQFFAESGMIAGFVWLFILGSLGRIAFRTIRAPGSGRLGPIAVGLTGSFLVFVIGSFFWVFTPSHELFAVFTLQAALLINIHRLQGLHA